MDCAGLATKSDIENIYALIAELGAKIPNNLATKEDIAGISSQLAQINQRLSSIENKQAAQDQELENIKNSQLAIQNDVGGLPSWISNAIEGIKDFFRGAISAVSEAISGVYDWLSNRAQWLWDKMGDVAVSLGNAISGVFDWVGDRAQWLGDRLWDFSESIADKIRGVFDWVGDRAQWLWDLISGALSPVKELIGTILNKLNTFDSIFANLKNRVDNIWDSVSSLMSRIWDFITDAASSVKNVILKGFSEYRDYIEGLMRWLYDALAGLFGNPFPYLQSIIEKCDYIIYLLVYGDGGANSGGGNNETDPENTNLQAIIDLINQLKADFLKMNNWVCGGLTLSGNSYELEAAFEGKLNGAIAYNFNGDLTGGLTRKTTNLSDLILNYLTILYARSGFQDYPISVPSLPLVSGSEPEQIVTASRFQSWQTKFIDNGIGAFPFTIRVEDSDLIKVGDQTIEGSFPNIAEALAEIVGMLTITKAIGEANTEIGFRNLIETASDRKQNFIAYKLIEAISDYLGFKTKQKKESLQFSFNPLVGQNGVMDTLGNALEATEIEVIIEIEDEKRSLEDKVHVLLDSARLIKVTNFRKSGENDIEELKQFFKDLLGVEDPDAEFDAYIEEFEQGFTGRTNVTDSQNPYGRSFSRRPKVRELGDQADQSTGE